MKAGITIREKPLNYPMGSLTPWPLLWISIGDRSCGYFAGEVAFQPTHGTIIERRQEVARALRSLAALFDGACAPQQANARPGASLGQGDGNGN